MLRTAARILPGLLLPGLLSMAPTGATLAQDLPQPALTRDPGADAGPAGRATAGSPASDHADAGRAAAGDPAGARASG